MSTGVSDKEGVALRAWLSGRHQVIHTEKGSENAKPGRGGHRRVLHNPFNPHIAKAITQTRAQPGKAGYLTRDLPLREPIRLLAD